MAEERTFPGPVRVDGKLSIGAGGTIILEGATNNAYETTITVTDPTADRTITLPNATTTLVGTDTTDVLTNKTLTSPVVNSATGTGAFAALTATSNNITAAMSGTTFLFNAATAITATLPATATGLWYKFVVQTPAGGGALHSIDCNGSDKFVGTNVAGTALDGADGVTLVNTQATAAISDSVTLIAITDGWLVTNVQGVWVKGT